MFGMWETTLAVAAGAASIPIIIHLLNRRRFRIVTWAAMRFLLAAQRQNTRRMRLEQVILLAVRVLLVLLIVLAMASVMPWAENVWAHFWPEGAGFDKVRKGRTHKIIILDASLSMNVLRGNQTAFERARDLAIELVNKSPSGDGFSVGLMKEHPGWIVAEASQDAGKVVSEIKLLQATHGNASVPATLNMVAGKVAETAGPQSRFKTREVYFFTDMQQATWLTGQTASPGQDTTKKEKDKTPLQEIQKRARTIFVDLGRDDPAGNLSVSDLKLNDSLITTNDLVTFIGSVHNYSQENRSVRVGLLVGKSREAGDSSLVLRLVGEERKEIKPGENKPVPMQCKFSTPGTYVVQMRLLGKDGKGADDLDADNACSVVVTVRDQVQILLVNGKPALEPFDKATEYLRLALNPFPKAAIPEWAALRPRVVSSAQFSDASETDLSAYDCVFLCDVGQVGTGELRRLDTHLRKGGGLVISAGDKVADHLDIYNGLLFKDAQGILPAKLLKKIQAPTDHHFVLQADEESFSEPPLRAFKEDDDRGSLRNARFRQYLQAKPVSGARVIMTFMPEVQPLSKVKLDKELPTTDPALIEWNPPVPRDKEAAAPGKPQPRTPARYRGKVVLVTSTLNMDWNSWPGSPSYGAMMQELARLAVAGRLREKSILVGQTIEEYLPSADAEVEVLAPLADAAYRAPEVEKRIPEGRYQVRDFLASAGRKRSEGIGDLAVFHWAATDLSGLYLLSLGRNAEEYPIAVNVPPRTPDQRSESDLTRVSKEKLAEAYEGWDFQVVRDPRNVAPASGPAGFDDEEEVVRGRMGPDIARYLLLAVLILLFVETVLAWVFGHFSAVAGSTEPAATGWTSPTVVAGLAALVFLAGAAILVHAVHTGDFLGFMPDSFRGWIESWLGVPPPAAGEATRWDLEFMPYLLRDTANDPWLAAGIALVAMVLVFFVYRADGPETSPIYKVLLGGLRLFLILLTLAVLLPQLQVRFDRQGWPDVVLLIDDSRSMGEPDHYQDDRMQEAVRRIGEQIKQREKARLPEKIRVLQEELERKKVEAQKSADSPARADAEQISGKIQSLENQLAQISSPNWRPTRLQLVQALLAQEDNDWLKTLLNKRRMKIHIFHLDANGRAIRLTDVQGQAGEITEQDDPQLVARAHKAVAALEAEGKESRLGTAVREVLDQYRGSSLSAVVMFTDGVTTRDETIGQVSEYAAQKGVPLFFVGIGDDHPIRDLKLHDLRVPDVVYVNDTINFQANLTGQGYKDLTVPVVLKFKDKDGKEVEVSRKLVQVDPSGKSTSITLQHKATKVGRKLYIIEIELPKVDRPDKAIPPNNTRLERTIDVVESKLIRVLYVEGTPRYEFRFIKSLLERERPDEKKNRSIELKILLLDADADFPAQDRSALADFPATREELDSFDVVILGDCDPRHPRLGNKRLKTLADFVRGQDQKGKKTNKTGGGLLMIAGPHFSPHAYRDTPLAGVLPIEPVDKVPAEPEQLQDNYRVQPTAIGLQHPIFRLIPDDAQNQSLWQRLPPLYWFAHGYRLKPLAEVLAVHPFRDADFRAPGQDQRHPLAVQQFVGSGRCMFYGFDETWRWRFREYERYFNNFWIETVRYLSRNRVTRTVLRLDRQTPYRVGEPMKVTVQFPDNAPVPGKPGTKVDPKTEVKVIVEYRPNDKADPEISTLSLEKSKNWSLYENFFTRTREGKYHFWLSSPDVSKEDPSGEKPNADARVELPPGELDRLRMNQEELTQAAEATRGRFYALVDANQLLEDLPAGARPSLNSSRPPFLLWNQVACFALVLFLLTSEWLLRKRKHML